MESVGRLMKLDFYRGKKVLVTGHTGFKGSWLCQILLGTGAKVVGYSLEAPTQPSLFELAGLDAKMTSVIGDVRDFDHLKQVFDDFKPEIVFHLAAQPLVRDSYANPRYTYETNVMGTVNLMECVRLTSSVKSVLNVTTDKVYHNNEWVYGYRENDPLDGFDPYSNSKSCSELVTHSYKASFLDERGVAVSTARAGNVIGGGDFAKDRIIPDCVRHALKGEPIIVRNPHSTRPYQHVLEPLFAYLMIAEKQYEALKFAGYYNVGPDDGDCLTTGELATLFCQAYGHSMTWEDHFEGGVHEANFLKLDCSLIKQVFDWQPTWHIERAIKEVVNWTNVYRKKGDIELEMKREIEAFMEDNR